MINNGFSLTLQRSPSARSGAAHNPRELCRCACGAALPRAPTLRSRWNRSLPVAISAAVSQSSSVGRVSRGIMHVFAGEDTRAARSKAILQAANKALKKKVGA